MPATHLPGPLQKAVVAHPPLHCGIMLEHKVSKQKERLPEKMQLDNPRIIALINGPSTWGECSQRILVSALKWCGSETCGLTEALTANPRHENTSV